jgi:PAS domain S-box-containing protein
MAISGYKNSFARPGQRWLRTFMFVVFFVAAVPVIIVISDRQHRQRFAEDAMILSASIDPSLVRNLSGSEDDLDSDIYRELKKELTRISGVSGRYRFAYLMGKKEDGTVFFYADSEPEGTDDESLPGESYAEVSAELAGMFQGGKPYVEGPMKDSFGVWVSALVPLYTTEEEGVAAVFGLDIDAGKWFWDVFIHSVFPISVAFLFLVVIIAGSFAHSAGASDGKKPALAKIFLALFVCVIFLMVAFSFMLRYQQRTVTENAVELSVREIVDRIKSFPERESRGMLSMLDIISDNAFTKEALRGSDAEGLFSFYASLIGELGRDHGISNLRFFDGSKEPIISFQDLCEQGHVIGRSSVEEAERKGKNAMGLFVCPHGKFILTVARPVFDKGATLGYVGMGKEVGEIVKDFTARPDMEIAVVVPASEFAGDHQGTVVHDKEKDGASERYGEHVFVFSSRKGLPGKVYEGISGLLYGKNVKSAQVEFDSRDWMAVSIPFHKMGISADGYLVAVKDITGLKGESFYMIFIGWSAFLAIGGILFGFFYFLTIRTNKIITDRDLAIIEKNRDMEMTLGSIEDGVISLDQKGLVIKINRRGSEITGWTENEAVGRKAGDVLNSAGAATGGSKDLNDLLSEPGSRGYLNFFSRGGREIYASVESVSKKGKDGNVEGSVLIIRDETREHAVQRKLKESQERFKTLFDYSSVAVMLYDKDSGKIIEANSKTFEMYGVSGLDELNGGGIWLEQPFSFNDLVQVIRLTAKDGPQHFEWLARRSGGEMFWEDVRMSPVDINGTEMVMAVVLDINDRKKAESALRISQMRLLRINGCLLGMSRDYGDNIERLISLCGELLNASCAMYNKMEDGGFFCAGGWNIPEGLVINGKTEDHVCSEVVSRAGDDVVVIEDLQKTAYADSDEDIKRYGLRTYMGKTVKRNGAVIGTLCVVYRDMVAVSENDKVTMTLISLALEMEETRKDFFGKISDSEKRFRTLVANVPGAIFRCANDPELTMWFISDRIEDLSGYPADNFIGNSARSYTSIIHPEDSKGVVEGVREIMSAGGQYEMGYRIIRSDGNIRWVQEKGQGIAGHDGKIRFIDGVITDMTEQKNAETIRQNFISTVSHELRTPLTSIKGSIGLVADLFLGPLNEEQTKFLKISLNNIDRLTRLINDILDFQKMDAGKQDYRMESGDINAVLSEVSEMMRFQAEQKGLEFAVSLDASVPPVFLTKTNLSR